MLRRFSGGGTYSGDNVRHRLFNARPQSGQWATRQ